MKHPVSATGNPATGPAQGGPLTRPTSTDDLPHDGIEVVVTATPQERAALARDFGLIAIEALEGRFSVVRRGRGVSVKGKVEGDVTQTCVVTLDPFPAHIDEEVDARFVDAVRPPADAGRHGAARSARADRHKTTPIPDDDHRKEHQANLDDPEPIRDGQIDLGALTAEFLALGLDPYPRKPGVAFSPGDAVEPPEASPFAALYAIKPADKD
jgi:hypothetical protein